MGEQDINCQSLNEQELDEVSGSGGTIPDPTVSIELLRNAEQAEKLAAQEQSNKTL